MFKSISVILRRLVLLVAENITHWEHGRIYFHALVLCNCNTFKSMSVTGILKQLVLLVEENITHWEHDRVYFHALVSFIMKM
jgi:hypothetical protein